jgi:hypothetical protein
MLKKYKLNLLRVTVVIIFVGILNIIIAGYCRADESCLFKCMEQQMACIMGCSRMEGQGHEMCEQGCQGSCSDQCKNNIGKGQARRESGPR